MAYTTYLDAATVLPTLQLEDPADYLAWLVAGTPIRLGGENTGNGTVADLDLCMARAQALDFYIVDWMGEYQLTAAALGNDPGGPTLAQVGSAFETGMASPQSSLAVTTTTLPAATVGHFYSASLSAIGGDPIYTWSAAAEFPAPGPDPRCHHRDHQRNGDVGRAVGPHRPGDGHRRRRPTGLTGPVLGGPRPPEGHVSGGGDGIDPRWCRVLDR